MFNIFSCACLPCVCLQWSNVYLGLLPTFWLGCLFFWYRVTWAAFIFWRLITCQLLHCKYFLPFWGLSFCFMVFSVVQIVLSLNRSHLFVFVFIFITLGGRLKKILLWFLSKCVLPIFSYKSFVVSGLTLRSLVHFEFIFVYGVREYSNFILLYVAVQFSQHCSLKKLSFLHCIFFPHLS